VCWGRGLGYDILIDKGNKMKKLSVFAAAIAALVLIAVNCNDSGVNNGNESKYVNMFLDVFNKNPNHNNGGGNAAYTLTVNVSPVEGGTVSRDIEQPDYKSGTPVTITAVPNHGYTFLSWSGALNSTNAEITIPMNGDKTLTAGFLKDGAELPVYDVYFNANGATGGAPAAARAVSGNSITLPGQAGMEKNGYNFAGWYEDRSGTGTYYPANSSYPVTRGATLYAKWIPVYTVIFNDNGATGGNAPAAVTADSGMAITLPGYGTLERTGYNFVGWNTNSNGMGTDYTAYSYCTVNGNVILYAKWTEITYTLTASVSPSGGGTVSLSPNQTSYASGTGVTVTATAASGYEFIGWSGASTSTSTSITITMNGDKALTANFQQSVVVTPVTGEFTDSRDGKTYKKVTIGSQTWMAENLNYETSSGSWCYDCAKYGRLYDWSTAMNVCPAGWHLPSRAEWQTLIRAVDANAQLYNSGMDGNNVAGRKLKSTSGWSGYGNGIDSVGFSALPGGYRYSDGSFDDAGDRGYWWTATEDDASNAYFRGMGYNYDYVDESNYDKSYGRSVRCVGDD
jgi:uncharacterized protein (TIGR02145 family)/uncharacterized repeat protein (TIGR02543 family)